MTTGGAARSAGGVAAAARSSGASARSSAAGVAVTGYDRAGAVVFTSIAPECVATTEACFVGWAAPSTAAGTLAYVTLAAPAGAVVVPALRSASFYPAAQPANNADACDGGAPSAGSWSSN
jgi:hypothetical protein